MYIPGDDTKRTARAPAKLNLYLDVGERRGDGFHELETLIVPIRIWDSLTLSTSPPTAEGRPGRIDLTVRAGGAASRQPQLDPVPTGKQNLVYLALELFQQESGSRFGAHVELVKRIPTAAGLGGGSSDAAAALRLANRAWQINWPTSRLAELAADLGSDVPFFLSSTAAICRGRGERIERLHGLRRLHFVVVKPPLALSTGDVYRAYDALSRKGIAAPNSLSESAVTRRTETLGRFASLDAQHFAGGRGVALALDWPSKHDFRSTGLCGASAFRQWVGLFRRMSPCTACTAAGRISQDAATGAGVRHQ